MRQDASPHRSSLFGQLFAERQVYLRSGPSSGYVLLTRPFQIGVTLALLLVLVWLVVASYSSVALHLEAVEQRREVARLEALDPNPRPAAAGNTPQQEVQPALAQRVQQLEAELEAVWAAREHAEQLAAVSAAEAEELRRELALTEQRHREVADRLFVMEVEREAARGELAAAPGTPLEANTAAGPGVAAPEELEGMRQELEAANARIAELERRERAALEQIAMLASELKETENAVAAEAELIMRQLALLKGGEDGAIAPAYAAGEEAIAALERHLDEARGAIESLQAEVTQPPGEELPALSERLGAASERLDEIESVLGQIKARDAALQVVLLNLAPPPPSPPSR